MKTTRFSFFLLSFFLIEQINAQGMQCGNKELTEREKAEVLSILGRDINSRTTVCVDPPANIAPKTYKLILE